MNDGLLPALGVDYGTKRVGIAVADALGFVHPLGFLDAEPRGELLKDVAALADDRQCTRIVVGLPLNMDGSDSPSARAARALGDELAKASGLPVEFYDEQLTSFDAEQKLGVLELTRGGKKRKIDAAAAATILTTWLADRRKPLPKPPAPDAPQDA